MPGWKEQGVDFLIDLSVSGTLRGSVYTPFEYTFTDGQPPSGWTVNATNYPSQFWGYAIASGGRTRLGGQWQVAGWTGGQASMQRIFAMTLVPGAEYRVTVEMRLSPSHTARASQYGGFFVRNYPSLDPGQGSIRQINTRATAEWQTLAVIGWPVPAGDTAIRVQLTTSSATDQPSTVGELAEVEFRNITITQLGATGVAPTFEWTPIKCDVQYLAVRHGKEKYSDRYDTAVMTLRVADPVGNYRYNPRNNPVNLRPGRIVRVRATYGTAEYPIAWMVIDTIDESYALDGKRIVTFACTDVSTLFGQVLTPYINLGSASSLLSLRVLRLLQIVGWPYYTIDTALLRGQQIVEGSGSSIWDSMAVAADSEGGHLYAERDGEVVFRNRNWASQHNQVTANFLVTQFGPIPPVVYGLDHDAGNGFPPPPGWQQFQNLFPTNTSRAFESGAIRFGATLQQFQSWGMEIPVTSVPGIPLEENITYTIEVEARTNLVDVRALMRVGATNGWNVQPVMEASTGQSSFQNLRVEFTVPEGYSRLYIGLMSNNATTLPRTADVWFRNLRITNSLSSPINDGVPTATNVVNICPHDLETEWSLARIINTLSLANAGGTARPYNDVPSQYDYGFRTYQRHDFVLQTDADLDIRAQDYFYQSNQSQLQMKSVSYRATTQNAWVYTLTAWLNQIVRVMYHDPVLGWGWTYVTRIMAVEHIITPDDWIVNLTLDQQYGFADSLPHIPDLAGWDAATWDESDWDNN